MYLFLSSSAFRYRRFIIIFIHTFTLCSVLNLTLRNFQGEEGREQSSDLHPLSILLDGSLEENKGKNFKLRREQVP